MCIFFNVEMLSPVLVQCAETDISNLYDDFPQSVKVLLYLFETSDMSTSG